LCGIKTSNRAVEGIKDGTRQEANDLGKLFGCLHTEADDFLKGFCIG
jgi:hypothetical protein